jgi:nucleotide-binding universal stress UspA family protein
MGIPIRTVVTATDFSASAEAGLAWGRALAEAHGATLHVVHVVPSLPVASGRLLVTPEIARAFVEAAQDRLEEAVGGWREGGLEVVGHVETGSPEEGIVEVAGRVEADVVVLSTRGHSGLRNLLSGSTARRVVRRSPCPVLTVHPESLDPVTGPATVLAAVDFSSHSLAALREALALLPPTHGARLRILHAWYLPVGLEIYGHGSAAELTGALAENREEVAVRLEELAETLRRPGLDVDTRLVRGFPDAAILSEAQAVNADLVVMGTQGLSGLERWILGSVAERVVQQAVCPVLTARAAETESGAG